MRTSGTSITALVIAAVLAASGCSGGDGGGEDTDLPDAGELMTAAADEMAGVETLRLVLSAGGGIPGVPVQEADAVVTATGDAEGVATVELTGVGAVEVQFVLVGDAFHYQAVGPWLEIPRADAAQIYDPSAILDPDRGVANLLRNAQDAQVKGRESVEGSDAYCVTATFAAADLAALLPGVTEDVDGTLWIGVERPVLHQAEFAVSGGSVTTQLSEFDEPVQISEP